MLELPPGIARFGLGSPSPRVVEPGRTAGRAVSGSQREFARARLAPVRPTTARHGFEDESVGASGTAHRTSRGGARSERPHGFQSIATRPDYGSLATGTRGTSFVGRGFASTSAAGAGSCPSNDRSGSGTSPHGRIAASERSVANATPTVAPRDGPTATRWATSIATAAFVSEHSHSRCELGPHPSGKLAVGRRAELAATTHSRLSADQHALASTRGQHQSRREPSRVRGLA